MRSCFGLSSRPLLIIFAQGSNRRHLILPGVVERFRLACFTRVGLDRKHRSKTCLSEQIRTSHAQSRVGLAIPASHFFSIPVQITCTVWRATNRAPRVPRQAPGWQSGVGKEVCTQPHRSLSDLRHSFLNCFHQTISKLSLLALVDQVNWCKTKLLPATLDI